MKEKIQKVVIEVGLTILPGQAIIERLPDGDIKLTIRANDADVNRSSTLTAEQVEALRRLLPTKSKKKN